MELLNLRLILWLVSLSTTNRTECTDGDTSTAASAAVDWYFHHILAILDALHRAGVCMSTYGCMYMYARSLVARDKTRTIKGGQHQSVLFRFLERTSCAGPLRNRDGYSRRATTCCTTCQFTWTLRGLVMLASTTTTMHALSLSALLPFDHLKESAIYTRGGGAGVACSQTTQTIVSSPELYALPCLPAILATRRLPHIGHQLERNEAQGGEIVCAYTGVSSASPHPDLMALRSTCGPRRTRPPS